MAVYKTFCKSLRLYLCGLAMGVCDLVPGISGSSMAHLLGYYEKLVQAVSRPKDHLQFLSTLGAGIFCAVWLFSIPLYQALGNVTLKTWLFSFFIGVSFVCAANAFFQSKGAFLSLVIGALGSACLNFIAPAAIEDSVSTGLWFFPAGMLAGSAMLLPAISGAQLLYILGLYPTLIESLAHFIATGNKAAFLNLALIGSGALVGFFLTSLVIKQILSRYARSVHGFFAGFIILSLPRLWPFEEMIEHAWGMWSAFAFFLIGIGSATFTSFMTNRQAYANS